MRTLGGSLIWLALVVAGTTVALTTSSASADTDALNPQYRLRPGESMTIDISDILDVAPGYDHGLQVTGGEHGSVQVDGDQITYTRDDDGYLGGDEISVRATQPSATTAFSLQFTASTAPVVASDEWKLGVRGEPVTVDVAENDSTTGGDPLSYTFLSASGGSGTCSATGTCTWTPDPGGSAGYLQYYAGPLGAGMSGMLHVDVARRAPTAGPDGTVVHRGGSGTIDLLANDDDGYGGRPTFGGVDLGDLSCSNTGVCTYDLDTAQWAEPHVQQYHLRRPGHLPVTGEVTLTMPAADDAPPQAESPLVATGYGTRPIELPIQVSDANGDPLTVELLTQPSHGTAEVADTPWPQVDYVPDGNLDTTDTFDVRVEDGHGGQADVTVDLTLMEYQMQGEAALGPVYWELGPPLFVGNAAGVRFYPDEYDLQAWPLGLPPMSLQSNDGSGWKTVAKVQQNYLPQVGSYQVGILPTKRSGAFDVRLRVGPHWGAEWYSDPLPVRVMDADVVRVAPRRDETVTIANTGRTKLTMRHAVQLVVGIATGTRWKYFRLPTFSTAVGRSVDLHTGTGRSTASDVYLGIGSQLPDAHGKVYLSSGNWRTRTVGW